jgi:hypothetical protein
MEFVEEHHIEKVTLCSLNSTLYFGLQFVLSDLAAEISLLLLCSTIPKRKYFVQALIFLSEKPFIVSPISGYCYMFFGNGRVVCDASF